MIVTDFRKIFLHCVITVICAWNWYTIPEENFMCLCDSGAWSNEEVGYYICTSNVTLCKKPERSCLFSFVIFVKPRCWMETVQYKPVAISAQHAWLQICHNKKKILQVVAVSWKCSELLLSYFETFNCVFMNLFILLQYFRSYHRENNFRLTFSINKLILISSFSL